MIKLLYKIGEFVEDHLILAVLTVYLECASILFLNTNIYIHLLVIFCTIIIHLICLDVKRTVDLNNLLKPLYKEEYKK